MPLIKGLNKALCTSRGVEIAGADKSTFLLGDTLYSLVSKGYQNQPDEELRACFPILRKLTSNLVEVELTSEEITLLKKISLKTYPPVLSEAIDRVLEAGGIDDSNAEFSDERSASG